MKSILLTSVFMISLLAVPSAFSQSKARYQDSNAVLDLQSEFFSLNAGFGFLTGTTYLEPEQQQDLKKLQAQLESLKNKYKSPAMDMGWKLETDRFAEGQRSAASADKQVKNDFNSQYSNEYRFIHAYQCTKVSGRDYSSGYVIKLNEAFNGIRRALFVLEKRLPEKTNSGALMMTNQQWKDVDGADILCKKFENGKVVDQQQKPIVSKIEKVRIPPYSSSKNPADETMCRNLNDPRIPAPPGVKCIFNYKK
jgi:Skp family chaperone for outer membrane proteins